MSILLSGDLHLNARNEASYITKKHIQSIFGKDEYNKIKYHVILGDCGFGWQGSEATERFLFSFLQLRKFPILCIFGNHESMYAIKDELPLVDIGIGEQVYMYRKENPSVYYLQRGKIYNIDGYKILALGGALSIDKAFRNPGTSWWPEEYWSFQEEKDLFTLLEREKDFDYVFAHTGPQKAAIDNMFNYDITKYKIDDKVAMMNDEVVKQINFKSYLFGHFHIDRTYIDERNRKYMCLYTTLGLI